MKTKCKIGNKLPAFSFSLSNDKIIKTKDLLGKKHILYFYPKDNTPGCTTEAKDFSAKIKEFNKLKTEIIGISKDSIKTSAGGFVQGIKNAIIPSEAQTGLGK